MTKILTITLNPSIDKFLSVDEMIPSAKLRTTRPDFCAGGGGLNVALALQAFDADVLAYWVKGGYTGDLLEELLEDAGLRHRAFSVEGAIRENTHVFDKAAGKEYRLTLPGPELTKEEWQNCLQVCEEGEAAAEYVIASGSLPPGAPDDFYARLVTTLSQQGKRVIVDTTGEPLRLAAKAGPFLLKPNLKELGQLIGDKEDFDLDDGQGRLEAAKWAREHYHLALLAITLGPDGGIIATQDGAELLPAPEVERVSSVGAGDSTVAGIVQGLTEGLDPQEAFLFGMAAGASAVSTPGHQLCQSHQTRELFRDAKAQA